MTEPKLDLAGLRAARYETICLCGAELSHSPECDKRRSVGFTRWRNLLYNNADALIEAAEENERLREADTAGSAWHEWTNGSGAIYRDRPQICFIAGWNLGRAALERKP